MKYYIYLTIFYMCFGTVRGESFNNPVSTAIARYAQLANSCVAQRHLKNTATMTEFEIAIFSMFENDYVKMCRPLVEELKEMYELENTNSNSETTILSFSNVTKLPRPNWSQQISEELDGRYVIYWNGTSFVGQFMGIKSFSGLIRKQQADLDHVTSFKFPLLGKQILNTHANSGNPKQLNPTVHAAEPSTPTPGKVVSPLITNSDKSRGRYFFVALVVFFVGVVYFWVYLKKK